MMLHMFLARPMTDFAGDAINGLMTFVFVQRPGNMIHPCVVAFHAAGCRGACKIAGTIPIKTTDAPIIDRMQPAHGKLGKKITLPREVDFIRLGP